MIELLVGFALGAAAVLGGVIVGSRICVRMPAEPAAPAPAPAAENISAARAVFSRSTMVTISLMRSIGSAIFRTSRQWTPDPSGSS